MGLLTKTLFGLSLLNGAATAERIADPFERHEHNFVLEGPTAFSEVFYASINWYDANGNKHDDREGDLLLLETVAYGIGALATRVGRLPNASPITSAK